MEKLLLTHKQPANGLGSDPLSFHKVAASLKGRRMDQKAAELVMHLMDSWMSNFPKCIAIAKRKGQAGPRPAHRPSSAPAGGSSGRLSIVPLRDVSRLGPSAALTSFSNFRGRVSRVRADIW